MRLTSFFLIAFCLHLSAKTHSQTISFSGKDVPLEKIFSEIERQTDYVVVWKYDLISQAKRVSIQAKDLPLKIFLQEVLKGQSLDYSIENQTIFIRRKAAPSTKTSMQVETLQSLNQFISVTGKISDKAGKALVGVSIQVKGTSRGTTSDGTGNFRIDAEIGNILTFTFVGYQSQQTRISDGAAINIVLQEMIVEMGEVLISGYQKRSRALSVGSVAVVNSRDLENAGITTFEKALAGKIPGVYVRSVSGRPGETGQIIIRGVNTLTGNNEPLYVLDGMPLQPGEISGGVNTLVTNGIGNIPPENIESITILKDATAASIYGSRAANGVIVITTKTGKAGADYITYSGKFGLTMKPENKFNFMNSNEKIQFELGLLDDFHPPYESGGRVVQLMNLVNNGSITQAQADAQIALLKQTNTNWIDQLYKVGYSQSHNITLSGGNTRTTYFTSFNYQNSQGSLIQNRFQTGGLNMKLSRFITDKLLVKVNLYTTLKKNEEGQAGMDPFKYAVFANPYEKPYNDDGSYAADNTYRSIPFTVGSSSSLYYSDFNIIRELKENKLTTVYGNIRGQFSVEYDFLRHFKYTGSIVGSYSSQHDKDESFSGTYRSWVNNWLNSSSTGGLGVLPQHNRGFMQQSTGRTFDYTLRNTIEFNQTFAGKHFVQGFFANEFGAITNDQFKNFSPIYLQQYGITGYPTWDLVPDTRFQTLNLARLGSTSTRENRSVSFIGSAAYSYDNRYVFNGNVRYDGVDIIGSDNQFSPLWSAGVKWNTHNEGFMKKYPLISRLVISAGFGYRGSINRSVLPFHTYSLGTAVYAGVPLATVFNYGNPVIKWEKKKETNLGLELSLFKGRINTDFRYFDETVMDLLDNTITPPSVGRPSARINNGTLTNKGFEVTARVEVIKSKDWLWELGGNITRIKNKLSNVFDKEVPAFTSPATRNIQGYPVNGWFGYKFSHVDPETGSLMVYAQKVKTQLVGGKVETTYSDQIVDLSKISATDLLTNYRTYYLGHRDPEYYGGFNTRLIYRAFEITGNFVLAGGNQITSFIDRREGPSLSAGDITASRTNRLKENLYRWRQPGDITDIPLYRYNASSYTNYMISKDIEDGSYLKCTELAFSWRAPRQFLEKTAVKTLKATLVASNLFTLSKYSGTDPETQTPFSYPNTRNYALSLNIGF